MWLPGVFRSISLLIGLGLMILGGLAVCIGFVVVEISREASYRHRYGTGWESQFATDFEPVSNAHAKMAVAVIGVLVILVLVAVLFRNVAGNPGGRRKAGSRRPSYGESSIGRITRFRRSAILGIYFGVVGIIAGVLLVLFRFGIFADHDNEWVLGVAIFLCGYASVINGCWHWLKAKSAPEALVSIGFMPFIILFIPYVRLIFLFVPASLPIAMVMMPLILIAVTAALPDRSGSGRRRPYWDRNRTPGNRPAGLPDRPPARAGDERAHSGTQKQNTPRQQSDDG